jgi:hypothetical protein
VKGSICDSGDTLETNHSVTSAQRRPGVSALLDKLGIQNLGGLGGLHQESRFLYIPL